MSSKTWPFHNRRYFVAKLPRMSGSVRAGLGWGLQPTKTFLVACYYYFSVAIMTQKAIFKNIFYHLDIFRQVSLSCDVSLVLSWTHIIFSFLQPPYLPFRGDTSHILSSIPGQSFNPIIWQRVLTSGCKQGRRGE